VIDCVYIHTDNDFWEWVEPMPEFYEYNGMIFKPIWDKNGYVNKYVTTDEYGLRHTITSKEYTLRNSLHKVHSKILGGFGNHSDFSYSDLIKVVELLEVKYSLNLEKTFIRELEIGVNVEVEYDPMEYINLIRDFKLKKLPKAMLEKNDRYGYKFFTSDYDIKVYDKSDQINKKYNVALNTNLLRYEIVLRKPKLKNIDLFTLSDLLVKDKFWGLVSLLNLMFSEIQFQKKFNLTILDISELELYLSGANREYWKNLPLCSSPATASRRRKNYKEVISKLQAHQPSSNSLIRELRKKANKKTYELSIEVPTSNKL